jgi:hypothetical protein
MITAFPLGEQARPNQPHPNFEEITGTLSTKLREGERGNHNRETKMGQLWRFIYFDDSCTS